VEAVFADRVCHPICGEEEDLHLVVENVSRWNAADHYLPAEGHYLLAEGHFPLDEDHFPLDEDHHPQFEDEFPDRDQDHADAFVDVVTVVVPTVFSTVDQIMEMGGNNHRHAR